MSFITVEHLKYRYPHTKKLVLDDVSFEIEKGEFIGIIGENGSGKSTLSQAFVGLIPQFYKGAYGGKVTVGGMDTKTTPISEICQHVGLVFQNPFNQLSGAKDTVYEEIAYGLHNLGIPRAEMIERIDRVMNLLGIAQYKHRNPFDLSGGQMQRVALASIMVMNPDVLILDEPTSQLDPAGSEEVFQAVEKLAKSGITIIMIEHKIEKVAKYCDRILLLQEGKVQRFDTPGKVFSDDNIEKFGVGLPAFTRISKALGIKKADNTYPVTLTEILRERKQFPQEHKIEYEMESIQYEHKFNIDDMSFGYETHSSIIKDMNLLVDSRSTTIIGQNGAGKTTLVKMLKGLLKPVSGHIYYQETDMSDKSVAMLAGMIGYVFQNPDDQIFKYRVMDEVMFGPLNIGMDRKEAKKKAEEALQLVGLIGVENKNPYDLELSQRKMVAIASVVAMDTDVIILDEPTIAQDYKGRETIKHIIEQLSNKGKTVIAILHDMDLVAECFKRVIVMAHGYILSDGTPTQVFADESVLEKACVTQPYITQLCRKMGYQHIYLTVEEFVQRNR
ncbi:ATPase component STY3233 of energizing module of queuosine-regulated ECF transporter [Lachnospiraceae bacterium KM106-2]|nr:ATPase component STY3233 of energizing module of queuosine-regulated ECF transporter [Lachnospiraceae bacterium KM106-2]